MKDLEVPHIAIINDGMFLTTALRQSKRAFQRYQERHFLIHLTIPLPGNDTYYIPQTCSALSPGFHNKH